MVPPKRIRKIGGKTTVVVMPEQSVHFILSVQIIVQLVDISK